MLEAERQAMKWEAYHSSLNIIEREMTLVLDILATAGNQAALMAGFTFVCFTGDVEVPPDAHPAVECIFILTAITAVGTFLFTIIASTMVSMFAPTMGLKGKDGTALRRAVEHMKAYRAIIVGVFHFGLCMFVFVMLFLVWFKLEHNYNAAISTGVIAVATTGMLRFVSVLRRDFAVGADSPKAGGMSRMRPGLLSRSGLPWRSRSFGGGTTYGFRGDTLRP